jgi:hypothetical protein
MGSIDVRQLPLGQPHHKNIDFGQTALEPLAMAVHGRLRALQAALGASLRGQRPSEHFIPRLRFYGVVRGKGHQLRNLPAAALLIVRKSIRLAVETSTTGSV